MFAEEFVADPKNWADFVADGMAMATGLGRMRAEGVALRLVAPHAGVVLSILRQMCERAVELDRAANGLFTKEDEQDANGRSGRLAARALGAALWGERPVLYAEFSPGKHLAALARKGFSRPELAFARHFDTLPSTDEYDPENITAGMVESLTWVLQERGSEIMMRDLIPDEGEPFSALITGLLDEDEWDALPLLEVEED
jgi:hypothetical protein